MRILQGWRLLAVVIIGLVALGIGWYLISPLFINNTVNEILPAANSAATPSKVAAATQNAISEAPGAMDEAMDVANASAAKVVAQGSFYNVAHDGQGKGILYELGEGRRIVRFEDFKVLNGPDLHVYLVPIDPVPNTVGSEIAGSVDLGKLKGNIGNQNYDVPASVDLAKIKSVVVWCQPFRVPFIAAKIAG